MAKGKVLAICVAPVAGGKMSHVDHVMAFEGQDLAGDRYGYGMGSFNKGRLGKRQVTLINGLFFKDSGFEYTESRRNIVTEGVELMDLIGKQFQIGDSVFNGVKYCDPCLRPSVLAKKKLAFRDVFHDRGGLVAEILKTGVIRVGDPIIPPAKGY